MSKVRRFLDPALFGLVFLVGLALRLYQLGEDYYWFDEFGVLAVVNTPKLSGAILQSRQHVMAMPLDYILSWVFARFSSEPGFMRIPAALWGAFTLFPAYFLFKRLSNRTIALTTCFMLALSPFHIQYSQELRFYSSLTFFYLSSSAL